MDKELVYVNPAEIRDYWSLIRPGLRKVREHSVDGWIEEDVYSSIRSREASLFIAYVDSDYIGFVVIKDSNNYDVRRLHVWCAYAHTALDPVELFIDDLKQMAKNISAKEITFITPRKGWERRLKKYGWVPVKQIYAMEV